MNSILRSLPGLPGARRDLNRPRKPVPGGAASPAGPAARWPAVIVVPVYRSHLTDSEHWNISSSLAVNPFPCVFVGPDDLNWSWYAAQYPQASCVEFPAQAFRSVRAYSRLLLDAAFYRPFAAWTFQILLQPDALLLRDVGPFLSTFEWDYAGAPWDEVWEVGRYSLYLPRSLPLERRLLSTAVAEVGNGGLSIRRVSAFVSALEAHPFLRRWSRVNEDMAVAALAHYGPLRIPDAERIHAFFCETRDPRTIKSSILGLHAMERYHPDVYAEIRARGTQGWLADQAV